MRFRTTAPTLVLVLVLALGCSAGRDKPATGLGTAGGGVAGGGAGSNAAAGSGVAGQAGGAVGAGVGGAAGAVGGAAGVGGGLPDASTDSGVAPLDAHVPSDAGTESPGSFDGGTYASQPLAAGPTYKGSVGGAASCDHDYGTTGFEPVGSAGERHPLFLYFVGTIFSSSDESSKYACKAGAAVTEAMARRGFVALSVDYDNGLSLGQGKLDCLYGKSNAQNVLARACALPQVNCDLGIATWGHSQGALMAHAASVYDARVRAVWTTGYSGNSGFPLGANRLRVVNGEADTMNGDFATITSAAGFMASECPNDGRKQCLRADGSGFIIVQKKDCKLTSADHCWFSKRNCGENAEMLEPNWIDLSSMTAWALEANADWIAATNARP